MLLYIQWGIRGCWGFSFQIIGVIFEFKVIIMVILLVKLELP